MYNQTKKLFEIRSVFAKIGLFKIFILLVVHFIYLTNIYFTGYYIEMWLKCPFYYF